MVFFKNVNFSQYADRGTNANIADSRKIRKLAGEKRRVRNNRAKADKIFLKKLKNFSTNTLKLDPLDVSTFLCNTNKGVSTTLFNFLKKNNPEHNSARL